VEVTTSGFFNKLPKAWHVHVLIWVAFYCLLQLYMLHKWDRIWFSLLNGMIAITFYLVAAYVNYLFLMPRYFKVNTLGRYITFSLIFVIITVLLRGIVEYFILFPIHLNFYDFRSGHIAYGFMTNLLAFIFGGLMYITTDYIILLKHQEALQRRQATSELALLKSQVQPHFLFNTLNNLYYLAYKKSEKTPQVIAKLSNIMRYFIDEAPKEKVLLHTELNFIKNYIDLESIRMVNPLQLAYCEEVPDDTILIPPMLLIPLVENIFKHGVDKMQVCNEVSLYLKMEGQLLHFKVKNKLYNEPKPKPNGGIDNLRQRLKLLYDTNFILETKAEQDYFMAYLKIPILNE